MRDLVRQHCLYLGSSRRRSSPDVTQNDGRLGLRPVQSLGMSVWAMATFGLACPPVRTGDRPRVQSGACSAYLLGVHGVHGDFGAEPVLGEEHTDRDDQDQHQL